MEGMSSSICTNDITNVKYCYVDLCRSVDSTSIYYRNDQLNYGSIVAISKQYCQLIELVQLAYKTISNSETTLVAKSFHNNWLSNILSISSASNRTILSVDKDAMNGTEDGSFVSCPGRSYVSYIKDGICIVVNIATRACRLFPLIEPSIDMNLCGVFKCYLHKEVMYIDRTLCPECSSIDDIVKSHGLIEEVSRCHTSNWWEFTPRHYESIVVRPKHSRTPNARLNDNAMSCVLSIFADRIDDIMQEICSQFIVIYGEPLEEFRTIVRKYHCCYVCQHTWDDTDGNDTGIFDLTEFQSLKVLQYSTVEDAFNAVMPNSIAIALKDKDCNGMKPPRLYVYTPQYDNNIIARNEYDMYLAIGVSKDAIEPHNSVVMNFNETNISDILKSIHIEAPDTTIMFNPSLRAYIDLL